MNTSVSTSSVAAASFNLALTTSTGLPSIPVTNLSEFFNSDLGNPKAKAVALLQTVKGAPKSITPRH